MLRRIGFSSTSSGRALFQQLWLLSCLCCILLPLRQHCQAWILSSSATKRQGIWPGGLAFSIQTPQHRQDDLQVVSTPSGSRRSPVLQMAFTGRSGGDYSKGKQAANFNPSGKAAVTGDRPVMERNTMQSNKVSRPAPITGSISQLLESLEMMKKDHQIVRMVSAVKSFATENRDVNIANYLLPILMEIEDKLTPTILPELLWAMGLLGFTTYDRQHRVFITDMMIKLFQWQELTSRQYTTALGGIVKMHVKWYNTDDTFKKLIINQLKRVAVSFNSREISNTLHSFSKLGLMWNDIDKAAQSLLVESLMLNAQGLISMQGSMSLYSLGIMGFNLDQVVPVVRDHIQQVAILVLEENFQINAGTGRKISQQVSISLHLCLALS